MDVTSIANTATALSQANTQQDVQIAVLRKALDSASSSAAALLDALPQPSSANLPAHLGQNVNTVA